MYIENTCLHSLIALFLSTYKNTKSFPVNSSNFRQILSCPYYVTKALPPHNHDPVLSTFHQDKNPFLPH